MAAVAKLSDSEALERVALDYNDQSVSMAAVEKLSDQEAIGSVALYGADTTHKGGGGGEAHRSGGARHGRPSTARITPLRWRRSIEAHPAMNYWRGSPSVLPRTPPKTQVRDEARAEKDPPRGDRSKLADQSAIGRVAVVSARITPSRMVAIKKLTDQRVLEGLAIGATEGPAEDVAGDAVRRRTTFASRR